MHGMHAATSKVENSTQGSSCKLKFVHGWVNITLQGTCALAYYSTAPMADRKTGLITLPTGGSANASVGKLQDVGQDGC